MKIKVTQQLIDKILNDPEHLRNAHVSLADPWWVILLKVIAYAIGLILGGTITTGCAAQGIAFFGNAITYLGNIA